MTPRIQNARANGLPTLPVNVLVADTPCLVVGGGPVACRKVAGLLCAGAAVHVVSPELCPDLADGVAAGRVTHEARRFAPADVRGMRLVFAATNKRGVNRQVLQAARVAGAFCCCVDGNWTEGDFTTPATLHQDGLTVAVSTGGRSCRQARMVKDTLGRHIRSIETADLLILGTSHEELSLDRREAVQGGSDERRRIGDMLMHVWGIHEFMLIGTCNRLELAAVASTSTGRSGLLERIMGFDRLAEQERYSRTGLAAFEHLALVVAGMQSQSPGEYHVASQVKDALATARETGWAGSLMAAWVAEALHISKHIKNEVSPLVLPVEIEDSAVNYAVEKMGSDWSGYRVLVLGTGMLGRCLVEKTLAHGGNCLWGYHVKRPALKPGWKGRVRLIPLADVQNSLGGCALIFCAASAAGPVLDRNHASGFSAEHPVLIMDLGVPRNVNPDLVPLAPGLELVNLDRLKAWTARRDGHLPRALALSRELVAQHSDRYDALLTRFQGRNKSAERQPRRA